MKLTHVPAAIDGRGIVEELLEVVISLRFAASYKNNSFTSKFSQVQCRRVQAQVSLQTLVVQQGMERVLDRL
jgi:hypothetical protein